MSPCALRTRRSSCLFSTSFTYKVVSYKKDKDGLKKAQAREWFLQAGA